MQNPKTEVWQQKKIFFLVKNLFFKDDRKAEIFLFVSRKMQWIAADLRPFGSKGLKNNLCHSPASENIEQDKKYINLMLKVDKWTFEFTN